MVRITYRSHDSGDIHTLSDDQSGREREVRGRKSAISR